jgi:hypothetical protein
MNTHRQAWGILGAAALTAVLAACGSSGAPSSTASTTPPSASSPAAGSSSAMTGEEAMIAHNWETFFKASTPVATRVSLLQDGPQFQSILKAQSGHGLAATASAKVSHVAMVTSSQAQVSYDILVSGSPVLSNQTGVAVKQNGTWKVGVASFCGLLHLEGLKPLPAACSA